jgi:hypothetical protein
MTSTKLRGVATNLDDERAACHNATASWKEVAAHDILQNRRLSTRLASDHTYLRQVQWVIAKEGEGVLITMSSDSRRKLKSR